LAARVAFSALRFAPRNDGEIQFFCPVEQINPQMLPVSQSVGLASAQSAYSAAPTADYAGANPPYELRDPMRRG